MTDDLLTADDLAYMRATQAEARPTAALLLRRTQVKDAFGGYSDAWSAGEPVDVRLDGSPDGVPATVGDRLNGGTAVKIVLDLVEVRDGDRVQVSPTEVYEVVTDGDPDRWATAQRVWGRRIAWPGR